MKKSSTFLLWPSGLFIGAAIFASLAASLLIHVSSAFRTAAWLGGLGLVGVTNYYLANYLISISAKDDTHHDRPLAILSSFLLFIALIVAYSGIYLIDMSEALAICEKDCVDFAHRITKAFYFSTVTVSTLGYGDISPKGGLARLTAAFEAINGLIAFGVFTGTLTSYVSTKAASTVPTTTVATEAKADTATRQPASSAEVVVDEVTRKMNEAADAIRTATERLQQLPK